MPLVTYPRATWGPPPVDHGARSGGAALGAGIAQTIRKPAAERALSLKPPPTPANHRLLLPVLITSLLTAWLFCCTSCNFLEMI